MTTVWQAYLIEGVKDESALKVWEAVPDEVVNRGSTLAKFHLDVRTGLFYTPVERKMGVRRVHTLYSRVGSENLVSYFTIYPEVQRLKIITAQDHKELIPELWGDEDPIPTPEQKKGHSVSKKTLKTLIR